MGCVGLKEISCYVDSIISYNTISYQSSNAFGVDVRPMILKQGFIAH